MRGRVTIVSGNSLCRNPRVLKEASALAESGLEVEVLGAWSSSVLRTEDLGILATAKFLFSPVLDCESRGLSDRFLALLYRAMAKGARVGYQLTGTSSRWQFGPVTGALARAVRSRHTDLAIAHSESGLAAVDAISQAETRVGVDLEDWYSEDLLPEARRSRPVEFLRRLEKRILDGGAYASATSRSMSEAVAQEYGCSAPAVIYNAFPWADRAAMDGLSKDRLGRRRPSIHWYSQTLGEGRGLGELLAALNLVRTEAEVHLRGQLAEGFQSWLRARIPDSWRDRIFIHEPVPNAELLSRIAEHDVGFAGEMKYCRNKEVTVSNKILHYLLAGLAVVASDTAGQREVEKSATGAVHLYPSGDANALALRLNQLLESAQLMQSSKASALKAAAGTYCWEIQEKVLLASVGQALGRPVQ